MAVESMPSEMHRRKIPPGVVAAAVFYFIYAAYSVTSMVISICVSVNDNVLIPLWSFAIAGLLVGTGCSLLSRRKCDFKVTPFVAIVLFSFLAAMSFLMNIPSLIMISFIFFLLFRWGGYPAGLFLALQFLIAAVYGYITQDIALPAALMVASLMLIPIVLLVLNRNHFTEKKTALLPFLRETTSLRAVNEAIKIPKGILAAGILIFTLVALDAITIIAFFISGLIDSINTIALIMAIPRAVLYITTGVFILKSRYGAYFVASILMIINISTIVFQWLQEGFSVIVGLPLPILLAALILLLANTQKFHSPEKKKQENKG